MSSPCRLNGNWAYCYRAIDHYGEVENVYFSWRRHTVAPHASFERAIPETGITPERVITDNAACYLPVLRTLLPGSE